MKWFVISCQGESKSNLQITIFIREENNTFDGQMHAQNIWSQALVNFGCHEALMWKQEPLLEIFIARKKKGESSTTFRVYAPAIGISWPRPGTTASWIYQPNNKTWPQALRGNQDAYGLRENTETVHQTKRSKLTHAKRTSMLSLNQKDANHINHISDFHQSCSIIQQKKNRGYKMVYVDEVAFDLITERKWVQTSTSVEENKWSPKRTSKRRKKGSVPI